MQGIQQALSSGDLQKFLGGGQSLTLSKPKFSIGAIVTVLILIIIGLAIVASSFTGLINIVDNCKEDSKDKVKVNSYGLTFGIGLGIAFLIYAVLKTILRLLPPELLIIALSIILIVMFSWNAYTLQQKDFGGGKKLDMLLRVNMALVGMGSGLLVAFILESFPIKSPTLMGRITAIIGCLAAIAFSSVTINAYIKCGKIDKNKAMAVNATVIALSSAIVIGLIISIIFFPA